MSDKQSGEDMKKFAEELEQAECKTTNSLPAPDSDSDAKDTTSTINDNDKSVQIDMDYEPGEDPKKKLKYYQDLAGLRGAREQYLQLDIVDLSAEQSRQADYINYLKAKLDRAVKEIMCLKSRRCRCDEEAEVEVFKSKQFSSISL